MVGLSKAREKTILLVEDDEPLRQLVATILNREDYRVLAAEDAIEAAEVITSDQPKLDLLIVDPILPGLGGAELAREILEQQRALKILFVSGSEQKTVVESIAEIPNRGFLAKPYTAETVLNAVRSALAG